MSFVDKSVLVTGASRGIGRTIAERFAADGARVFCVSSRDGGCDDTIARCRELGARAVAIAADVSDPVQVVQLAEAVQADGGIDFLVNNAGITRDGSFLRMRVEDFDVVHAVNLRGCFLVCQAFVRGLARKPGSRIVNITSVVGVTGNAGQANYAASKAGVVGLTKSLAKEFGGRGLTVNAIAPGFIETDMTASLNASIREKALAMIPLGRFGTAADIAGVVAFLCSEAAAYLTGQVLIVDGGMTM